MKIYLLKSYGSGIPTSIFTSKESAETALCERVAYIKSHLKSLGFIKKYAKAEERERVTNEMNKLHVYNPEGADYYYLTRSEEIEEMSRTYTEVYSIMELEVGQYAVNGGVMHNTIERRW